MAPTINQEIGLRRESDRDISPPALLPAPLESPLSAALPRTVAGRHRRTRLHGKRKLDWAELSTFGLIIACAVLSVYRLFWAIQF